MNPPQGPQSDPAVPVSTWETTRWVAIPAGLSALVALLALAGSLAGSPWLGGLGPGLVPLAPLSALLLVLVDAALLLESGVRARRDLRTLRALASLLVIALSLGVLAGFLLGGSLAALLAVHRMSKLTALMLLALGLATGAAGPGAPRWRRQVAALAALVPAGLCAVVLLSYAAGAPLLYQSRSTPMSLPAALAGLAAAFARLAGVGRDTWPASYFSPGPEAKGSWRLRTARGPMGAFLLLALAVLVGGSFYLRAQLTAARLAAQGELAALADLKAGQIAAWRRERLADAELITGSALLRAPLRSFLRGRGHAQPVREWMAGLRQGDTYRHILLLDARGGVRLAVPGVGSPAPLPARVQEVLAAGAPRLDDLSLDGAGAHLDLWAPLGPEGVLLLRIDPRPFLFPLIQSWPAASPSAETLLVRRDGDGVLFLNDLRHRPATALTLRLPLEGNPLLPAAMAARGVQGTARGTDYRGVPVLAAIRGIPLTAWSMIAKVDEDEIFGPLRTRGWISGATLLGLVTLLALGVSLRLRQLEGARAMERLAQGRQRRILEGRFENLLRMANDAILIFDARGRILDANDRALSGYGRTLREFQAMHATDLRAPEDAPAALAQFEELSRTGAARFETVHLRKDGTPFPVQVSSRLVAIEGDLFAFSLIQDISERRARERELARLTHLYEALSQVNQAIVWNATREELFTRICEVLVKFGRFRMAWIAGIAAGGREVAVLGRHGDTEGYLEDFRRTWSGAGDHMGPVAQVIREGRPVILNDFLAASAGEPWREAAVRSGFAAAAAFPIRLRGDLTAVLAVYHGCEGCFGEKEVQLLEEAAMDMSFALDHLAGEEQRERAEARLHESEERFRMLFEKSPVGYLTLDAEGRLLDVNETLLAMLGYGRGEVTGRSFWEFMAPQSMGPARACLGALRTAGRLGNTEFTLLRKDGTDFIANFEGRTGFDEAGRFQHTHCVLSDLTERLAAEAEHRELQAQLHQSQKMESLGSLAGGIAHDINNVLAAILSLASAHREGLPGTDLLAQSLDTIATACLRGRDVVKSLLYFARKGATVMGPVDLNDVVRDLIQLLARTTLKRIRLETDLQEPLPRVLADAGNLSHVLMNLCVNAKDAMPGGGAIRIRTRALEGGGVEVGVRDTGEGMSEEVRKRAMEPFFTTKPTGQGTGLGLAMVFGTMASLGGSTELVSSPGQGTEVLLRFPAMPGTGATPAPEAAAAQDARPRRSLRILLVDDDELIRSSVAPMLQLLGHETRAVESGIKALQLFEAGLEVDLVILDMNMPGLNGAETLHGILLLRPAQAVIMASGYNDHDLATLLDGRPGVQSIAKPFHLHEIQRRIAALDLL